MTSNGGTSAVTDAIKNTSSRNTCAGGGGGEVVVGTGGWRGCAIARMGVYTHRDEVIFAREHDRRRVLLVRVLIDLIPEEIKLVGLSCTKERECEGTEEICGR